MEQTQPAARTAPKRQTREQWQARRRRRRIVRLVRNWIMFLGGCAVTVMIMTTGILWLLPKAHALVEGERTFEAAQYDGTGYVFDADDARLALVNANLPFDTEPEPELALADDATGAQLETEAAEAYRNMAAAALEDGIELKLSAGYQSLTVRQAAHEIQKQLVVDSGYDEDKAEEVASAVVPKAESNEHGTGYAADILSEDHTTADSGFADTRAYQWLQAYAAEYGFILRYPEDRQVATGVEFKPYHWRYVGVENALAIRASGLSLEEFLAVEKLK